MPAVRFHAIPVHDPDTGGPLLAARGAVGNIVDEITRQPLRLSQDQAGNIPVLQPITITPGGYIPAHWNLDGLKRALFVPLVGTWTTPVWSPQGLEEAAEAAAAGAGVAADSAAKSAESARRLATAAGVGEVNDADTVIASYVGNRTTETGRKLAATYVPAVVMSGPGIDPTGEVDSTSAIAARVQSAVTFGASVHWPEGTYLTSGNIPGFHATRHSGRGAIRRGGNVFYIEPGKGQTNRLFVATEGGTDANDGLTAAQPKRTIQSAFDAVAKFGPALTGEWRIVLGAGTYANAAQLIGVTSEEHLTIEGPPVAYGTPTAVIDPGAGATYGLWFGHGMRVHLRDVKVQHVTGSTVAAGVVLDYGVYAWLENVHTDDCTWAGLNANIGCRAVVQGGNYKAQTYGIRVYGGSVGSIGYNGHRTTVTAVTGVIFQANSSGHTDNTDFIGCDTGLIAESKSHTSNYGNTYTTCNVGWQTSGFGSIATDTATRGALSGVTIPSRHRGGFATGDDELTHRYAMQYRDDLGTGRLAFGYAGWTAPWVKYQFANGVTGANLSAYAPETALFESDGNTIVGITSKAANTSELWFGADATPNAFVFRYAASVAAAEMRFGTTTAYRFRPTDIFPLTDNALDMGRSTFRWRNIYAGTGTIQTSDERDKQDIEPITDAVLDAWADVDLRTFRFRDAVAAKGEDARTHVGVIAQQIVATFEAHGLHAADYGLVTYDEWDDQWEDWPDEYAPATDDEGHPVYVTDDAGELVLDDEGRPQRATTLVRPAGRRLLQPAGDRYGIRADECLFLEAALVRRRLDAIGV